MIDDMGLGAFDADYETIQIKDRRATVPDGKYVVSVVDATLDKDPGGSPRFTLFLEVQEGDHAGTVLAQDSIFSGDSRRLEFFKKTMLGLGMAHIRPSELQRHDIRASFVGLRAEVSCVSKAGSKGGSFFNVYVNRRLDGGGKIVELPRQAPAKAAPASQPLDDGLPF